MFTFKPQLIACSPEQQQQKSKSLTSWIPTFKGSDTDYSRLYKDEKKRADELNNDLCVLVQDFHNRQQETKTKHDNEIGRMKTNYENKIRQMKTNYENEIQQMRMRSRTENLRMQQVESEYESKIEKMGDQMKMKEGQMKDMERRHDAEQQNMLRIFDDREKEFMQEKLKLAEDHAAKTISLENQFEAEKSTLLTHHAAEKARLKKDVENLNGALIARDHFKPLTDVELAQQFLDLDHEIEVVAGIEWKFNKTGWDEEPLQKMKNHQQRKFRKAFLHESIWIVLYDNVLSTPFKVFGDEGRLLEIQWADTFNKGGSSPLA